MISFDMFFYFLYNQCVISEKGENKKMRKILTFIVALTSILFLVACGESEEVVDYSGVYEGYSWSGEASGVAFEEATQYIKTTLYIAKDGTIVDAAMDFQIQRNGVWVSRLVTEATAEIDYEVDPVAATPGANYAAGTSMFTVTTGDWMSFYAVGVSEDGTVALPAQPPSPVNPVSASICCGTPPTNSTPNFSSIN